MDMPMKEYLERPEMSASALEMLIENARKYKLCREGKLDLWTKEKDYGTVFHTCILEPEKRDETFVIADDIKDSIRELAQYPDDRFEVVDAHNKNLKKFQEAKRDNPGKIVITTTEAHALMRYKEMRKKIILRTDEFTEIQALIAKAMDLKDFKEWLEQGKKEQVFFGEIQGVPFKIRTDLLVPIGDDPKVVQVFDLKTLYAEATAHNFGKASAERFYFLSEIIYRKVLKQNGFTVAGYSFVAASKVPWSGADYFKHQDLIVGNEDYEMEGEGQKILDYGIAKYKYCFKHNVWPERQFDYAANEFPIVSEVILPMWPFFKYQ